MNAEQTAPTQNAAPPPDIPADIPAVADIPTAQVPTVPSAPSAQETTARLAQEFLTLMQEFPQLCAPSQLPDSVLDTAAGEGISLLDAYLRYRWQEEKRVAAAQAARCQAAACAVGSLSRGAVETPPEQDAFLRAFRSAL